AGKGSAEARFYIGTESGHMPRFLARLVCRVFLRPRIAQDVAERCRKRERALFAVKNGRQRPTRRLVGETDVIAAFELLAESREKNGKHFIGQNLLAVDIERFAEIDVFGIERIPEVIVGRGNDPVE